MVAGTTVPATFDGRWMRLYLDGNEIGSLERPGAMVVGGIAAAGIGSSDGAECFQGVFDDLRIYAGGLNAQQIAMLHRQGREIMEQSAKQLAPTHSSSLSTRAILCRGLSCSAVGEWWKCILRRISTWPAVWPSG